MTHAQLQAEVTKLCLELGLLYGVSDPLRSCVGWFDLVVLGPKGLLVVELKKADGRRSNDQIRRAMQAVTWGLTYRLWRPADLDSDAIKRDLEAIA